MKEHNKSKINPIHILCFVLIIAIIGYFFIQGSFNLTSFLLIGLILLCPIMMMFMMKGHKH